MKKHNTFILFLLFLFVFSFQAFAEDVPEKIRVGYNDFTSFIDRHEDGSYSGYGISYLNEISEYTNFEYEFVFASWDKCLEMLEDGKIDLISFAQRNNERSENFCFTENSVGIETTAIYTLLDNDSIYYEDFQAMQGKNIGILSESFQSEAMFAFAKKHNIEFNPIYFFSDSMMLSALENGVVDMIVTGSLAFHSDLKPVALVSIDPFFCITNKNNPELAKKIDNALEHIQKESPYFEASLYNKYYSLDSLNVYPSLTREEAEYLYDISELNIAFPTSLKPLSYVDENGYPIGIYEDIISNILNKLKIKYRFLPINNSNDIDTALKSKKIDLFVGTVYSESYSNEGPVILTDSFYNKTSVSVIKKGNILSDLDVSVVAVPKTKQNLVKHIEEYYPNSKIIFCEDSEKCLSSVKNGNADVSFLDSFVVNYLLQKPRFENLVTIPSVYIAEEISVAAPASINSTLLSALNKSIDCLDNTTISKITMDNLVKTSYKFTFYDTIYKYRIAVFISVLGTIGFLFLVSALRKKRLDAILAKKEAEDFRTLAERDTLTGLYNKETFYAKTHEFLMKNPNLKYNIVCIDIERFKIINDLFGIKEGDNLLVFLANVLSCEFPKEENLCARLNADNFAICVLSSEWDKFEVAKNGQKALANYPLEIQILLRYGIYPVTDHSQPVIIMCDRANLAAESIKGNYIRHYAVYNNIHRQALLNEQEILNDMNSALTQNEFKIFMQPKCRLDNGEIVGCEALVRWIHPKKGLIPPNIFIEIFEKNGFILSLDLYVWEEVCKTLSRWRDCGLKLIPISVNVSRADFYSPHLVNNLLDLIEKYNLPPSLLELEVTESVCNENEYQLFEKLKLLQNLGFRIAMDDFGSGYSSLNMLKEFPVDILKLDLRFLQGDDSQGRGKHIMKSIIKMAGELNLSVIAEGVETDEDVHFLQSANCEFAQGYYFSKPIPIEDFEKLISKSLIADDKS